MTESQKQARIEKAKQTMMAKRAAIRKPGARTVIFNNQARFFSANACQTKKLEVIAI